MSAQDVEKLVGSKRAKR